MQATEEKIIYKDLSYRIIELAMEVHRELGFGSIEKIYENAMMVMLRREKIDAFQQAAIAVHFDGELIGEYVADILIDTGIILELKSVEKLTLVHRVQALNYLKATGKRLAILINFGKEKLEYERLTF